jgi:Response regulators consisting of a CheY-like receiver domain and a winged-helix DNA-binding domain
MDVGLPDGDGVSLCREWRAQGENRPILFLTAKDEEFDVVRGLDSGGNDYVTKPFRMQELLSRVRVLLRNSQQKKVLLSRNGFAVDEERMQVQKNGEALPLTLTEYRILTMLLESKAVVPREKLLQVLWDDGGKFIDDNTLSVHMSRLREKVGADHIRTVRGVGYQWSDM